MNFSTKIKALSVKKGITQRQLCSDLHMSLGAVSAWFNGSKPHPSKAIKLADYFGIPVDILLDDDAPLPAPVAVPPRVGVASAVPPLTPADRSAILAEITALRSQMDDITEVFSDRLSRLETLLTAHSVAPATPKVASATPKVAHPIRPPPPPIKKHA